MGKKWMLVKLEKIAPLLLGLLLCQSLACWSLNEEGLALLRLRERVVHDPFRALSSWIEDDDGETNLCSWFGVECWEGKVVALNLKDLCLEGSLPPEIGTLFHLKSIILRNNSLSGIIPEEIGLLKQLEVLDLGHNNFSGPLPHDFGSNLSLTVLLLDNNELLSGISYEVYELQKVSKTQVAENLLSHSVPSSCYAKSIAWRVSKTEQPIKRSLLQATALSPEAQQKPTFISYEDPPWYPFFNPHNTSDLAPSSHPSTSAEPSENNTAPAPNNPASPPSLSSPSPTSPERSTSRNSSSSNKKVVILAGAIGGAVILVLLGLVVYLLQSNKVSTVKPWATGLSGQLQKAFVTGVPKLKRSELVAACEDFSNVIGTSSIGAVYKGTLSSGVEIAVVSVGLASAKDWSRNLEAQFRKKVDTLSKLNHKNFVNLLGYCEEDEAFTRMLVFEYAPNGTLFEHLHIKESEHLDWGMRLRIAMGIAYCLEHLHQLDPPVPHSNLSSSCINLTEDYAAKVSHLSFWNETVAAEKQASGKRLSDTSSSIAASDVYNFGVLLFETATGRMPYSVDDELSPEGWASDYLKHEQPLKQMVDPTLKSFDEQQLDRIEELLESCIRPNPLRRPTMSEIAARLREITGITQDAAVPRASPLWWAEVEILSSEAS